MTRTSWCVLTLSATVTLMPSAGAATPLYSIDVSHTTTPFAPTERFEQTSAAPVSHEFEFFSGIDPFGNFFNNIAFAAAEEGMLRASAHAVTFLPNIQSGDLANVGNGAAARAGFVLDDIIILGPDPTVETSINLSLDGGVSGTANAFDGGFIGYEATGVGRVRVFGSFFGTRFDGNLLRSMACHSETLLCDTGFFEDEMLTGFGGAGIITTPITTVLTGVPLRLVLTMDLAASAVTANGGFGNKRIAEGEASFGSTLSFALSGPVFNLPAGYTASSVGGLIVDNRFVGAAPPAPAAVPEPGTMSLVGVGVVTAFARRLRRRTTEKRVS